MEPKYKDGYILIGSKTYPSTNSAKKAFPDLSDEIEAVWYKAKNVKRADKVRYVYS